MSGDPTESDPDRDEAEPVRSFFDGLREVEERWPVDGPSTRPDHGSGDGRPREGARRRSRPDVGGSDPASRAVRAATDPGEVVTVGAVREGRFGFTRGVRTAAGGATGRLDVRAYRVPDGDPAGFRDALVDQLGRWAAVGDVDGVVPVVETGRDGRPWAATARRGPALDERDATLEGLAVPIELASTLAALHDSGVVHAGIEPRSVVVAREDASEPRPAFRDLGLVDVYRRFEDPGRVLDPRYAPPEYFGDGRSVADRATDVYGLGAVCFRLLTGVAPYAGSLDVVAERVTCDEPIPRPSHVNPALPSAVDDVLRTATAVDKFERYDTAGAFRDALEAAADD